MSRFLVTYFGILAIAFCYALAIFLMAPDTMCNPGIAFGIALPPMFINALSLLCLVWLSREAYRHSHFGGDNISLGFFLVLAGGFSNTFERIFSGCVHDFLPLVPNILNNPADWLIAVGILLLIASSLKKR